MSRGGKELAESAAGLITWRGEKGPLEGVAAIRSA